MYTISIIKAVQKYALQLPLIFGSSGNELVNHYQLLQKSRSDGYA